MSVTVRSKGHDILIRSASGKRLRITREWAPVSDFDFEKVQAEARNLIEVKSAPAQVTPEPATASETEQGTAQPRTFPPPAAPASPSASGKKSRGSSKSRGSRTGSNSTRGDAQ